VTSPPIVVLDNVREISSSFAAMLSYHGGGSPGGVAHAFKVAERSLVFRLLKPEMAAPVMSTAATDGYDVEPQTNSRDERRRGRDH
jgi:hypothetical protein